MLKGFGLHQFGKIVGQSVVIAFAIMVILNQFLELQMNNRCGGCNVFGVVLNFIILTILLIALGVLSNF